MAYGSARRDHDRHIDFLGFAPDADIDQPGACHVMDGVIPTPRGWRAMPGLDTAERFSAVSHATVPSQVFFSRISSQVVSREGNQVLRYSYASTSNTATGALTIDPSLPSVFLDYGIYVTMVGSHTFSVLSNNTFVAITGAPSALIAMVSAARFAVGFDYGDGWYCSARDDVTSWTASPATLAAFGSLPGLPDDHNKSAVAMGDDIILFKGQTAYRGRFEPGNAEVWNFERLPINVAAHFCNTSVPYRNGIVVLAEDGLYYYDGAVFTNLMEERMARWWSRRSVRDTYLNRVIVDEVRDLLWISVLIYDSDTAPSATYSRQFYVCDPSTKRWSRWNGIALAHITSGPHFYPGAWLSTTTVRSNLWVPWATPAVSPHHLREIALAATAASSSRITTNDFGDAFIDSEITRASLKFISAPTGTASTATGMFRNNLEAALTTATPIARSSDGLYNIRQNARWHRLQFDLYGDFEVAGYAVEHDPTGMR